MNHSPDFCRSWFNRLGPCPTRQKHFQTCCILTPRNPDPMRVPLLLACLLALSSLRFTSAETLSLWLGTTTPQGGQSQGIYRCDFDTETGSLTPPTLAASIRSPGFLTQHPSLPILYSVCQLPEGGGPGVAAWQIGKTASLQLLSTQPIADGGATHLAIDAQGQFLFTA